MGGAGQVVTPRRGGRSMRAGLGDLGVPGRPDAAASRIAEVVTMRRQFCDEHAARKSVTTLASLATKQERQRQVRTNRHCSIGCGQDGSAAPGQRAAIHVPFSEVRLDPSDLIQPEKLPDTEAVWTLWSAARDSFSATGLV